MPRSVFVLHSVPRSPSRSPLISLSMLQELFTVSATANRRNLELKVQCEFGDLDSILERLHHLNCGTIDRFHQVDTYVEVAKGRLKLREFRSTAFPEVVERAELIAYARANTGGSRWSNYEVVPIAGDSATAMLRGLLLTHRELARIDKLRQVGVLGKTRVHIDRVEGLGAFVELETVVDGQEDGAASTEHNQVIAALGLDRFPVVAGSYSDLAMATGTDK